MLFPFSPCLNSSVLEIVFLFLIFGSRVKRLSVCVFSSLPLHLIPTTLCPPPPGHFLLSLLLLISSLNFSISSDQSYPVYQRDPVFKNKQNSSLDPTLPPKFPLLITASILKLLEERSTFASYFSSLALTHKCLLG